MVISDLRKQPQPLVTSNGNDSSDSSTEENTPNTPADAPPAYTGTARSIKRSSYNARHDLNGIIVREADIGNGCVVLHISLTSKADLSIDWILYDP